MEFHYEDKAVVRPSYLHDNGIPYIGKTASLYWNGNLEGTIVFTGH